MKKNFYFPGMLNKLKQYITACDICERTQWKRNNNIPMHVAHPTIVSRHLINFDLGKRFMKEEVYEPFLYYVDLFVL